MTLVPSSVKLSLVNPTFIDPTLDDRSLVRRNYCGVRSTPHMSTLFTPYVFYLGKISYSVCAKTGDLYYIKQHIRAPHTALPSPLSWGQAMT